LPRLRRSRSARRRDEEVATDNVAFTQRTEGLILIPLDRSSGDVSLPRWPSVLAVCHPGSRLWYRFVARKILQSPARSVCEVQRRPDRRCGWSATTLLETAPRDVPRASSSRPTRGAAHCGRRRAPAITAGSTVSGSKYQAGWGSDHDDAERHSRSDHRRRTWIG